MYRIREREREREMGEEERKYLPVKAYYDQSKANEKREEVPSDEGSV